MIKGHLLHVSTDVGVGRPCVKHCMALAKVLVWGTVGEGEGQGA